MGIGRWGSALLSWSTCSIARPAACYSPSPNPTPQGIPIARDLISLAPPAERAILVGAPLKGSLAKLQMAEHLEELARLADTAGAQIVGEVTQQLNRPDPGSYLGKGKLEELKVRIEEMSVYNPNGFNLDATRLTYKLWVDSVEFGTGAIDKRFTVQEKDSTIVSLPLSFNWSGVGSAGREIMNTGSVNYRVTGDITVRSPIGNHTLPYDRTGRFSTLGGNR